MMKLGSNPVRFSVVIFVLGVFFATDIWSQDPIYVQIQVTFDAKAPKGKLGSQWYAMQVRNTFGVDFVMRQRIPQSPKKLLVYLDGGGSVGHDNYRQLRYPDMIRLFESEDFADILVFLPQCSSEALNSLVAQMQAKYGISREHTLIWGISLGAFGLLDCVTWHPELYGSIVSLAGGGDPTRLSQVLRNVSVWLIHGTEDSNVPPSHSQRIADELHKHGIPYQLKLIPGANHGILEIAMKDPEFADFLISWAKK